MTSYEFYVCKYGGKAIQPDEWQTAYADADALIRRYERLYRVEYSTDSAATQLYVPLLTHSEGLPMCRAALWLLRPASRLAA